MKSSFKKIKVRKQTITNLTTLQQLLGGYDTLGASAQACSPRCALTEWPTCQNCPPIDQ
jgi:hypothetical protein